MKAIILLGPPGAGKGTVAAGLTRLTSYVHVSTGDILRKAIKNGSSVGLEAKSFMEKGDLVPDDVIVKLIRERIAFGGDDACYMFDGFPRTMKQTEMLEGVISGANGILLAVFLLEAPEEILIKRLTGRRICRDCGAVYHIQNIPSKVEGVCDKCGGELYQRPDDTRETVVNRLDVYRTQTADLIGRYEEKDLLIRVDSTRGKEIIDEEIVEHLKELEDSQ